MFDRIPFVYSCATNNAPLGSIPWNSGWSKWNSPEYINQNNPLELPLNINELFLLNMFPGMNSCTLVTSSETPWGIPWDGTWMCQTHGKSHYWHMQGGTSQWWLCWFISPVNSFDITPSWAQSWNSSSVHQLGDSRTVAPPWDCSKPFSSLEFQVALDPGQLSSAILIHHAAYGIHNTMTYISQIQPRFAGQTWPIS